LGSANTIHPRLSAADGDVLHGKFRSPILEETEGKALVRANAVVEKVNMVHNCDHRCAFTITDHHCAEEREMVRDLSEISGGGGGLEIFSRAIKIQ
jgi:hypothetical protein